MTLESKSDGKSLERISSAYFCDERRTGSCSSGRQDLPKSNCPKRYYKPYTFELIDVKKRTIWGRNTPRSYASKVHLLIPPGMRTKKNDLMNNPLRFADETFYQSGYTPETASERNGDAVCRRQFRLDDALCGMHACRHWNVVSLSVCAVRFLMDEPHSRPVSPLPSFRLLASVIQSCQ